MKYITLFLISTLLFSQQEIPSITSSRVDSVLMSELQAVNFVGIGVIVSNRDSVLYQKTFGYSNIENQQPISIDSTIFRIASVSKLLTTISVMTLVQRGILDLKTDINNYLPFKIDYAYDPPITLIDLLTHTAGFEDKIIGTYGKNMEDIKTLRDYLRVNIPEQIYPPGKFTLYSNHSFALAGLIVEHMSETPFLSYIENTIIKPLGLAHSFVSESPGLQKTITLSYILNRSTKTFERNQMLLYRNLSPAGMMNMSIGDMNKLMQNLLQFGQSGNKRILNDESIQTIFKNWYSPGKSLYGYGLSLYERRFNKKRLMTIGGQLPSFSCQLTFINEDIAIYLVANTSMNRTLIRLSDAIISTIYLQQTHEQKPYRQVDDYKRYTGRYHWNRYSRTQLDKMLGIYRDTKVLNYNDSGYFHFWGMKDKWIYQSPNVFTHNKSDNEIHFVSNNENRIIGIKGSLILDMPVYLERFKWIENPDLVNNSIGILLLLLIGIPLVWLIIYLFQRFKMKNKENKRIIHLKVIMSVAGILNLFYLFAFRSFTKNYVDFITGNEFQLYLYYSFSYVITVIYMAAFINVYRLFGKLELSIFNRISLTVMIISMILYYLLLLYFKLIWFAL